jgi:predicted RNA binding protein YcfA (HicA-like mRNA interferase family)
MSRKLPRLKSEEVIRVFDRHGFELISQRGSHQKWRNPDTGKQVIIPYHKAKMLPLGTMRSIIEGSGITETEFRR